VFLRVLNPGLIFNVGGTPVEALDFFADCCFYGLLTQF